MSDSKKTKRQQAFEIYKEHDGNIDLIEIARLLDGPPGTVRGWKSKDKWDKKISGAFQKTERNVPEKAERSRNGGAPFGNQNAKGNKGNSRASPPKGNKNAVVTGEYETIYADYLTDEEKSLLHAEVDSSFVLREEIQLLRVRQARMLKRRQERENGLDDNEKTILKELRGRSRWIETKGKAMRIMSDPELITTEVKETTARKIDDILRIEEALTRISNQLTKAVKQYDSSLTLVDKNELVKYQVEKLKAEVEVLRGSKEGNEDATDWKAALANAEKELAELGEADGD